MSTPAPSLPRLTETVDTRAGVVRAAGYLSVQGADLLHGTVETLQRLGHDRITLDLRQITGADAAGRAHLDGLGAVVSAAGGRLHVLGPAGETL